MFRETVRKVFDKVMTPKLDQHEREGVVGRAEWRAVGEAGLLCPGVREEHGGMGLDFGYNAAVAEEQTCWAKAKIDLIVCRSIGRSRKPRMDRLALTISSSAENGGGTGLAMAARHIAKLDVIARKALQYPPLG